ncbi:MAG: dioxygenase [Candidatus Dormiibacterota bacterium]
MSDSDTPMDDNSLRNIREQALTDSVLRSFANTASPRHRAVMESLVRHLHAFIREVRLTDDEWRRGIEFLTRTGHITDQHRQEFILLSDVLGASMMIIGVNETAERTVTESTVFGPFFLSQSPQIELGGDIAQGAPGQPCFVEGTVRGIDGELVGGARVEVWGADEDGLYDVQHEAQVTANRGHLFADESGSFSFWAIRPTAYPIPTDGPVGELLRSAGRGPMRPAHLHFMISAPGWRTLVTHLFAAGDRYLEDDAVFGVKESLVVDIQEHREGDPPLGHQVDGPWASISYHFVLAPTLRKPEPSGAESPDPV